MTAHKYILEVIIPNDPYRWIIYCHRCGHVSYYGNASLVELREMRDSVPLSCVDTEGLSDGRAAGSEGK